jgi:hypothetical protein
LKKSDPVSLTVLEFGDPIGIRNFSLWKKDFTSLAAILSKTPLRSEVER